MQNILQHSGKEIAKKNGYSIIECENCGFKHVYPFPDLNLTEKMYSKEYYELIKPEYIGNLEKDRDWWKRVYKERIENINNYLTNVDIVKTLDIGSGAGYFLEAAKRQGWDGIGVEPSYIAYRYSKEQHLNTINQFYDKQLSDDLGEFDVIHMNHVLEHIINPENTLKLIYQNLKNEGILCIAVPNDFNEFQKLLSEQKGFEPWWVVPEEHINYFTFKTLIQLLEQNGFEVLKKSTSFPMELFLLMGDNYIGNNELGRLCHGKRKKFEENLYDSNFTDLKDKFYETLADSNIGRDVILYVRKRKGD
ncbi:class I SAM-dependent methyltransferase [Viridibacillus arvi]|uniref:class I SAM-dependent methyltransferase n=1 Tax=Viridibacillus arvi TaxID=263475 RepID=UPI003CFEE6B6